MVARRNGSGEVEDDSAVADRTCEPGRARAHPAGLLGKLVVFRGGPSARAAPSDGPALRRAGGGRRPDGRIGRSLSSRQGAFDHAGSESLVDIAFVPEGEGSGLSA